jgi:hypothetical protein
LKYLLSLLFLIYIGSISLSSWNNLTEDQREELPISTGIWFLKQKPYCSEVQIIVSEEDGNVEFNAICLKHKI